MTFVTLTADTTLARVVIDVTGLPPGDVTLTRADANGTRPVRRQTGHEPIAGALTVVDYEASMVGTIRYDVTEEFTGRITSQSVTLDVPDARPRVAQVQLPANVVTPEAVTGYDAARRSATVVHWVEGRVDPVVIMRPPRTREGTLVALSRTYANAASLLRVIAPGTVLMLRQSDHPGMDMYLTVTESQVNPLDLLTTGWSWSVRAMYVELAVPTLPLLGAAGWTFANVTAAHATFGALTSDYATFSAVTVGPL